MGEKERWEGEGVRERERWERQLCLAVCLTSAPVRPYTTDSPSEYRPTVNRETAVCSPPHTPPPTTPTWSHGRRSLHVFEEKMTNELCTHLHGSPQSIGVGGVYERISYSGSRLTVGLHLGPVFVTERFIGSRSLHARS